jgi:hypothetical protein
MGSRNKVKNEKMIEKQEEKSKKLLCEMERR